MAQAIESTARPGLAIPPGDTLAEELEARGLSQSRLARHMDRPVQMVNEIVRGVKAITAETALQLERVLGISAEFWMNLESSYRLTKARLQQKRFDVHAPPLVAAEPVTSYRTTGRRFPAAPKAARARRSMRAAAKKAKR